MKIRERTINVTTSIPLSTWNLAKEKRFPWNEALILGIRVMNGEGLAPNYKKMQDKLAASEANEAALQSELSKLMETEPDE